MASKEEHPAARAAALERPSKGALRRGAQRGAAALQPGVAATCNRRTAGAKHAVAFLRPCPPQIYRASPEHVEAILGNTGTASAVPGRAAKMDRCFMAACVAQRGSCDCMSLASVSRHARPPAALITCAGSAFYTTLQRLTLDMERQPPNPGKVQVLARLRAIAQETAALGRQAARKQAQF